jgi:hypothetical protein
MQCFGGYAVKHAASFGLVRLAQLEQCDEDGDAHGH